MPVTAPIMEKVLKKKSYERGKAEGARLKALETARLMLGRNMDIDVIADLTGLFEDEVRELESGQTL